MLKLLKIKKPKKIDTPIDVEEVMEEVEKALDIKHKESLPHIHIYIFDFSQRSRHYLYLRLHLASL